MFWAEIWKISEFLYENFQFLLVKFSIYLNRRVFVMCWEFRKSFRSSIQNCMLRVLNEAILMRTHNLQFHDKIKKIPLIFVVLSYRKNSIGTQKRIRIIKGKLTNHRCSSPSRKHTYIILTPLNPYFYIVKLGFTGIYITFLISAQKHRLWVLVRTASTRRF